MRPVASPGPLVGRAEVLAGLTAALAEPACVVLLTGPAGAGRSAVVGELARLPLPGGRPLLTGRCAGGGQRFPLGAVVDALAPAAALLGPATLPPVTGALHGLLPELAGQLPPPPPSTEPHLVFRGLTALLAELQPVLVLEDLHAADPLTLRFLRYLVGQPPAARLVLTSRRSPAAELALAGILADARRPTTELAVEPLDLDQLALLPGPPGSAGPPSAALLAEVLRCTAGLPGLAAALLAAADLPFPPETPPLPASARRELLGRISELPDNARQLVQAAAVLDLPVTATTLAAVAGLPPTEAATALPPATEAGLLAGHPDGTFAPAHPLARAAAAELTDPERRRQLHLRAARRLRSGPDRAPLAELARHHRLAASPRWPQYAEAAADEAARAGRGAEAVARLGDAARAATGARRARLALKLSQAALTGRPDPGTVPLLREVLAGESLPTGLRGELRLNTGMLLRNQAGAGEAGREEIAEAIADLTDRPELAARAMSTLAIPSVSGWPFRRHLQWLTRSDELAATIGDPDTLIAVQANRVSTLMFIGDPAAWDAVRELPAEPGSPVQRQHLTRANANLAQACVLLGLPWAAAHFLARVEELLKEAESPYFYGLAHIARLILDWTGGHWEQLDARAAAAAADYADIPDLAAEATLLRGLHALVGGRTGTARRFLTEAQRTVRQDTGMITAASAGALARIELAAGRPGRAREHTGPALDALRRIEAWVWAAELVPAAVQSLTALGDRPAAEALTAEFADGLAGRDAPAGHAALATCRALLGPAPEPWTEAEHAWSAADRPYEQARARLARGRALMATGQEGAPDVLAALDRFTALGATWDTTLTRTLLRDHGITPPTRGGRRPYGDALSPREREIAELAAAGLRNAEIAERLVLSHRTVEHHIANAMRKLAVPSRTALGPALALAPAPENPK
ncbi:LuxR C-terminal-related transcriptional regulator [Kitasatospora misakiensis]|uniref:LuxR C-terminal-related transcriptional regulator n=1 Tax=Kitasatospora misakiensis TaxID=67330 RepID=A0ABW0X3T1_9ACTN